MTEVTIPFKGERNYAQIADIFTTTVALAGCEKADNLVFTVHAPLFFPFATILDVSKGYVPDQFCARLEFTDQNGKLRRFVVTRSECEKDVPNREFDEAALRKLVQLDGDIAHFSGTTESSFAELVTAMNKKLLQSKFPQDHSKWWAVRLHLTRLPESWNTVTLTNRNETLARIYSSTIEVDNQPLGEINFVLRKA